MCYIWGMFYQSLQDKVRSGKKALALLIDPDKHHSQSLNNLLAIVNAKPSPDIILVGGSIVFNGLESTIQQIKAATDIPVYIFPGSAMQVTSNADGIFLLSLISGRNPEFLIGNHIQAAPLIKKYGLAVVPTGYMLVNAGTNTSVQYMSNTSPIPYDKTDIAVATALAGQQLGLQQIYLEAGSGAQKPVAAEMIKAVKENTMIPLIVGGGIRESKQLHTILKAGADMVVIGTASEKNPKVISEFSRIVTNFNP